MEDTRSLHTQQKTQTHNHWPIHAEKRWVRGKERLCDCQFNEIVLHSIELPTEKENKSVQHQRQHQN